jgi:hypothetical protein
VVDAEDLLLAEHGADLPVERLRRLEVVAERLLDDHPAPLAFFLLGQSAAEMLDDHREEVGRHREIEEVVSPPCRAGVALGELGAQPLVERRVVEIAWHVVEMALELLPALRIDLVFEELRAARARSLSRKAWELYSVEALPTTANSRGNSRLLAR